MSIEQELQEVRELISTNALRIAEEALCAIINKLTEQTLPIHENSIKEQIDRFHHKRRRDLTNALNSKLESKLFSKSLNQLESSSIGTNIQTLTPTSNRSRPVIKRDIDLIQLREKYRDLLNELSSAHIFQWSTFYTETIESIFSDIFGLLEDGEDAQSITQLIFEEFARHSTEICSKGLRFTLEKGQVSLEDAIAKSINGLQRFLTIPLQIYSSYAFTTVKSARQARNLRLVCSAMLAGILDGYAIAKYADQKGRQILPRFPRSWAHVIAFLNKEHLGKICLRIEPGEFREGLEGTVVPIADAIDRLLQRQSGTDYCLPRMGQYVWEGRYIEISLSLPRIVEQKRYLEVRCYINAAYVNRRNLEECANRGISVIATSLRPDIREWVEVHDVLRTVVVDTSPRSPQHVDHMVQVQLALDILNHEISKYLGTDRQAEPITFNLAKSFPLHNPFLNKFFLVQRRSVQNLLKAFEQDTGVRLWCSIRRSGKTTASFDLSSTGGTAIIVNQTMDHTEQHPHANIFYERFVKAISLGEQLPSDFFSSIITDCIRGQKTEAGKIIVVLDEYESLFDRMRLAVQKNRELRYTVVQPLLNQMVGFSRENLLIFIGQRPDSHYIIMDQNQLSPYVKQDSFPLFEHKKDSIGTEFSELVRKILTERVNFDTGFIDAVYRETSGHPYLTVNVLVDFYQWLIDIKRRANELSFGAVDFNQFSSQKLKNDSLRQNRNYEFFRNFLGEAIGQESRKHTPWLYAVCSVMKKIAVTFRDSMSCPHTDFQPLVKEILEPLNLDSEYILSTAIASNFLSMEVGNIRPAIRLLGRISMNVNPRLI